MSEMNMIQALNHTLHYEFARNEDLVVFGEDCGYFGGIFRVTTGLQESFGEQRCFDISLCGQGIIGFGIGMAQKGLKAVCEIQSADYIFPGYHQIVNELAKMRYRTGNQYSAPMVVRVPYGGGICHSHPPEAQFLHTPGIVEVVPSNPYDAKGLLLTALRCNDPVLFWEPKRIYRSVKQEVPEEEYAIAFGKAFVARAGKDITLIGWGAQHHQNLAAAKELAEEQGIEAEVIDLRTLKPLDIKTVVNSVVKTGRCVVCHEASKTQGFGAEIAARIMENCFYYLEAPVGRCCGMDTPFPHALEHQYLPDACRVKQAVIDTIKA